MTATPMQFEVIDSAELASRWNVPASWVVHQSQPGYTEDPIPHKKLGRYVRYEWGSPALAEWWARR